MLLLIKRSYSQSNFLVFCIDNRWIIRYLYSPVHMGRHMNLDVWDTMEN
uniref:Uncharacterized protein n=1 Tax=Arundo donax TaxID=35708 RepID=A0A0A9F8G7_ARUDO